MLLLNVFFEGAINRSFTQDKILPHNTLTVNRMFKSWISVKYFILGSFKEWKILVCQITFKK